VKIQNADNTFVCFACYSRGRRTSVTDRLTSVTEAAQNVTTYAYDLENNLTSITMPLNTPRLSSMTPLAGSRRRPSPHR